MKRIVYIFLLLIIIQVTFHTALENALDHTVVKLLLKNFESSVLKDAVMLPAAGLVIL